MSFEQHVTITSRLSDLDNMDYSEMQKLAQQLRLSANGKAEKLRSRIRTRLEKMSEKTTMTKEEVEMQTLLDEVNKKFVDGKTYEDIAVTLREMSEQCQHLLRMVEIVEEKIATTKKQEVEEKNYKDTVKMWANRVEEPLTDFKSYIDKDIIVTIFELFTSIHYFKKKLHNILF